MSDLNAIVIDIYARYCVFFILNFVERNLRYTRFCLTLIRDICFEPNFRFKNRFCVTFAHAIPYLAYSSFENRICVILDLFDIRTRYSCSRLFCGCWRFLAVAHVFFEKWRLWCCCLRWRRYYYWISVHDLLCAILFYWTVFRFILCSGWRPPSSSSQALATTPWGYGTSPPINSSPSWEATRGKWRQLRSTGAGGTWRQVRRQRLDACWNMFSRHFSHAVPMLWCFQNQFCIWWCCGDDELIFAYKDVVVAMKWACVGWFCNFVVWFEMSLLFETCDELCCNVMWNMLCCLQIFVSRLMTKMVLRRSV